MIDPSEKKKKSKSRYISTCSNYSKKKEYITETYMQRMQKSETIHKLFHYFFLLKNC